jgi:endonuclease-3
MATTTTTAGKAAMINQLLGAIEPLTEADASLPVLEQLLFGICREGSSPEMARLAFNNLKTLFFDWNEVRVSSTREIEDALEGLSDTESRAVRIISLLQEVFESTFSFDLEHVHKKGLKQGSAMLARFEASTDHVVAWVVQRSMEGHAIPVDAPTLRVASRLGLVDEGADPKAARAALEHLVPKAKGQAFTDAVSLLAEQACWEEEPSCGTCPLRRGCPSARSIPEPSSRSRSKPR